MTRDQSSAEVAPTIGCLGILARVAWLGVGNGLLVILAAAITQRGADRGTDVLFLLVVVFIVVARYVDVRWLGGLTTEGERASMAHWWRHVAVLLPVAAGLWAIAHLTAEFVNR